MRHVAFFKWAILVFIFITLIYTVISCTKEKIIIYRPFTNAVELVSPPSGSVYETVQPFTWESLNDVRSYQLQVSRDAIFSDLVFTRTLEDTTYTHTSNLLKRNYYWRVRAKNDDDVWGDWSDATVWTFRISDGTEEPDIVELVSPPNNDLTYTELPDLLWEQLDDAIGYQVNISTNSTFTNIVVDENITDTVFQSDQTMDDDLYYWRVRAKNEDYEWGDWSDAMVWSFTINTSVDYLVLKSTISTYGIAQDVFVVEEGPDSVIAYIADGASGLTIVNVTDPENPVMMGNMDHPDGDFGTTTWKVPGDEIVYMADLDGKIAALDIRFPLDIYSFRNISLGFDQNVTDIAGTVFQDTIYIAATRRNFSRREIGFYQIVYRSTIPGHGDLYSVHPRGLPADGKGACFDSLTMTIEYYEADRESTYYEQQDCLFAFAGASQAGLFWYNLSQTHGFHGADTLLLYDPRFIGSADTPYDALKLKARNGFVYVADDRSGLQIFDLPDTIPAFDHGDSYEVAPVLIADINTSGRTKDVHLIGNYCYLADANGGLKIIDVSDPYNPVFLDAYTTPYAYGVFATEDYIYICDRDIGLMIFENGDLIN